MSESLSLLKHHCNILREGNQFKQRTALEEIEKHLASSNSAASSCLQELFNFQMSALLSALRSDSEKVREGSARVILKLVNNCPQIHKQAELLTQVVLERLGGADLEGVTHLPEQARPSPSQLPCVMIKHRETSEVVRMILLNILDDLLQLLDRPVLACVLPFAVEALRAFAMDPMADIQIQACKAIEGLATSEQELLQKLSLPLARALLLPLSSKKSKPAIAALKAIEKLLIAAQTDGVLLLDILAGSRDPNSVAIKEFYQATFNFNYLASLYSSSSIGLKEAYLATLFEWLSLPNRDELIGRLMPYFLSFLSEENENLARLAIEYLERLGLIIEKEKEEVFRDDKQFGLDKSERVLIIAPFIAIPRLGARFLVSSAMKRLIIPLVREIKDTLNNEVREKSVSVLLHLVFISGEECIQYAHLIMPALEIALKNSANPQKADQICLLLGSNSKFNPITEVLLKSFKDGETPETSIRLLRHFIEGVVLHSSYKEDPRPLIQSVIELPNFSSQKSILSQLSALASLLSRNYLYGKNTVQSAFLSNFETLCLLREYLLGLRADFDSSILLTLEEPQKLAEEIITEGFELGEESLMTSLLVGCCLSAEKLDPLFGLLKQGVGKERWTFRVLNFLANTLKDSSPSEIFTIELAAERIQTKDSLKIFFGNPELVQTLSRLLQRETLEATSCQKLAQILVHLEEILCKKREREFISPFAKLFSLPIKQKEIIGNDIFVEGLANLVQFACSLDPNSDEFEQLISTLSVLGMFISDSKLKNLLPLEHFTCEMIQVLLISAEDKLKSKVKSALVKIFEGQRALLKDLIQKADNEQRLQRLKLFKTIEQDLR